MFTVNKVAGSRKIVLSKNIKSMAKLFSDGIVIMYDVKENVNAAAAEMSAAGVNVKVEEDWACY